MKGRIRKAAVAGQFYNNSPSSLRAEIEDYLANAKEYNIPKPLAIIAPHAGYVYSGQTAAEAFSLLKNKKFRQAVVIAPSHRCRFEGLAYGPYDYFHTPLGDIQVENGTIAKIAKSCPEYIFEAEKAHIAEHALEVELPFLQIVQPDLPIVPLICGNITDRSAEAISAAMIEFLSPENIWIISSDFTHFGYSFGYVPFRGGDIESKIEKLDMGAIEFIVKLDYKGFTNYVGDTGATICGENPIRVLLKICQNAVKQNAKIAAKLLSYTNSGKMTGDFSHCVSYASIAFYSIVS